MGQMETEVLIIGGGVLGAAVARELSKYKVERQKPRKKYGRR